MINEIDALLGQYRSWLKEKTSVKEVNGWIEITTPYLDRNNDCLQIFAKRDGGSWYITDDGYTVGDLEASGLSFGGSETRKRILDMTLNGFGVRQGESGELNVTATDGTFAAKKHNLLQAMLAVGDMFYLARTTVRSLFFEDVRKWMDESDIRYTPSVKLTGKSGYDHYIDFIVPRSNSRPERLVQLMNNPTKSRAETICFSWIEVRDTRPQAAAAYAIINDGEREVPSTITEAFAAYEITPVLFSRRADVQPELAA
jgi:Domain of unknown function DUF1828/Domain of unknown function DUF1829